MAQTTFTPMCEVSFADEFKAFHEAHPDFDIVAAMGAFAACQGKSPDSPGRVYGHSLACDWCPRYIENLTKAQKRSINERGWWSGDFD